jgi:hypothetical protein
LPYKNTSKIRAEAEKGKMKMEDDRAGRHFEVGQVSWSNHKVSSLPIFYKSSLVEVQAKQIKEDKNILSKPACSKNPVCNTIFQMQFLVR